jgi:hypothetical protein
MIEVIKTPETSLNECSLCDTIKVTYKLIGEEPVTVEVELIDGQYVINDVVGVNDLLLTTSEDGWNLFYNVDFFQGNLIVDGCPLGIFTLEEGSIFESFVVEPVECFTSKWSAVHHPIKWELQRKDAEVVEKDTVASFVRFELTSPPPTGVTVGMSLTYYNGTTVINGIITLISTNFITINQIIPGVLSGGYIIFNNLFKNYYIETEVEDIGTIRTIPNQQGRAIIDVSAWLRTQTIFENNFNYNSLVFRDGQSGSYRLRFRENFNFQTGSFGLLTSIFYWTNSAKQIRDAYGSNMILYVANTNTQGKFLTVFNRPTNFIGFPFSLSWINTVRLILTYQLRRYENDSTATNIDPLIGINRLMVTDTCESVAIQYGTTGTFTLQGYLTETKQIKINQTCLERPLAVSWLNTLGGREHWVFSYNQIHSLDTQSGATYQPNIDDLETATSNIFDLQKFAQPKISVGANVDVEDIEGLKTILYSICVEIQTAQGWIGVRTETGSFKILETKDTKATIEMTFILPDINIQTR